MKKTIKATIIKEDTGFSAHAKVVRDFIGTQAETIVDLRANFLKAARLAVGRKQTFDIKYSFDLESFFTFYKVINAKALSERIGMNQSLLAQYIKGRRKPSEAQRMRILSGVQEIGRELAEIELV
jgi:transcriptional regulator with XRE-family HTH domain